jgi:hypothetical protein
LVFGRLTPNDKGECPIWTSSVAFLEQLSNTQQN